MAKFNFNVFAVALILGNTFVEALPSPDKKDKSGEKHEKKGSGEKQNPAGPVRVNNNKFLQELHESFLEILNKERDEYTLMRITMDPTLTNEAQAWADENAMNLKSLSSCEEEEFQECKNYTEVYAMRRATRSKQPVGKAAAEWLWKTWFATPDPNSDATPVPQNVLINIMGLGVSYVTAPDKSNHVYAVARFAEVDPDTYYQDKKLHEIIYFPDEVDITKTYVDPYKKKDEEKKDEGKGKGKGRTLNAVSDAEA